MSVPRELTAERRRQIEAWWENPDTHAQLISERYDQVLVFVNELLDGEEWARREVERVLEARRDEEEQLRLFMSRHRALKAELAAARKVD